MQRPPSPRPQASPHAIPRKPLPLQNPASNSLPQPNGASSQKKAKTQKWAWTKLVSHISWLPEFASLALALAMLAAIVILLTTRQAKPLPTWPSVLGINSLVSIFSSVFKVALLFPIAEGIGELKWIWFATPQPVSDFDRFEAAGRDPWGAFKMLIRHPLNFFTSLGAAVVILSIGIDPFTQQVLQFYTCPVAINGATATIARTNSYDIGTDTYLDLKLNGAIYQGLLNPPANATAAMSTYCPSGQCTFPHSDNIAYSSLAMCSKTTDISDSVKGRGSGEVGEDVNWYYSLPSGLNLSYPDGLACWNPPQNPVPLANDSLYELEVLVMTTDCTNPLTIAGSHDCSIKPLAVHVDLSPCVIEYGNVSITNSIFQEQAVSSQMLPSTAGSFLSVGNSSALPNTDCTGSKSRQGNKTALTAVFTSGGGFLYRCPESICASNGIDILWYDPTCIFYFGSNPTSELQVALDQVFLPSLKPAALRVDTSAWPTTSGYAWLIPMWASGSATVSSISKVMESLTNSLNAVIRPEGDLSAEHNAPARGVVLGDQTCVGVEWPWFALPCALITLTFIFLICTILQSRRYIRHGGKEEGRTPWKSSTMPLLWCGLTDATRANHGPLDGVEEMKQSGNGTDVSLGRGSDGRWELVDKSKKK